MPKKIENLREKLIAEARRQLFENGYATLTIRSVADACGTAVGTIYNYFPSKEMLVGNVVLSDWLLSLSKLQSISESAEEADTGLRMIYGELNSFHDMYRKVFSESPVSLTGMGYPERHNMLRGQLEGFIGIVLRNSCVDTDSFTITFIAESMLFSSVQRWDFERIGSIFGKLLK